VTFRNRQGQDQDQKWEELEKTLGIQNIKDIEVDEANSWIVVYTETKRYKIPMTEF